MAEISAFCGELRVLRCPGFYRLVLHALPLVRLSHRYRGTMKKYYVSRNNTKWEYEWTSTRRPVTNPVTGRRTSTRRPVTAWIAMRKGVTGKEFTLTSWKTEIAKCRRARTTRTLCKRRTGEDIPRAPKFGRIDNSRAQSFNWDLWIKKHSPIRCHGARFGSWKIRDETKLLGTWKPKVIYTDNSLEFGINLWSWPWNYSKVYVDTLPFKKIWDCWIAVCWTEVKSFALLLQSTNKRSKICWKRRKPSVQNLMGLLNSGTLNRGRNLCVTDAIDHSTVDGFHDELQLSAKNTNGKALRRISWVKEFYLVRWKEHHSIFVFDLLKFHHFGSTALPETLSEYVWYAEGEVWKGTLIGSRPWAGGQNRRVRIPQCKTQREGDNLAQFGNSSKNRRWTIETFWRRSGENIHLDRGQRTQNEEKFQKTFLEKFHQPPKQEVIAHQHIPFRDQSYPHQNCFEKYLGKLVMNFFNKQTYAVYYRLNKLLLWFSVYQQVLPQACPLQHPWHLHDRNLIILRPPQARLLHQSWHLQLCQATVWLDKNGETCVG